ncbi:MAG: ion channel [Planctomycetota bacterium]
MSSRLSTAFRALTPQGQLKITARGRPAAPLRDLFHQLLVLRWSAFLLGLLAAWLLVNAGFACLYLLDPEGVAGLPSGSFAHAFSFSVQTLSTIGYGGMAPHSGFAHAVMCAEAFVGMVGTALVTGLTFAKFSRSSARVLFTSRAVIATRDGAPCFMVRIANARDHGVLQARAELLLVEADRTLEGEPVRRFRRLRLERERTPVFSLTWTLVHPIDAESPLHGRDRASLEASAAEVLVTVTGIDGTISQPVMAQRSYVAAEIEWDQRFADMLSRCPDGGALADYDRFDVLVPNEPA